MYVAELPIHHAWQLVVAPATVLDNWLDEVDKWAADAPYSTCAAASRSAHLWAMLRCCLSIPAPPLGAILLLRPCVAIAHPEVGWTLFYGAPCLAIAIP